MNYTTDTTYTVSITVWHVSEKGSRFISKVIVVYADSEEEAKAKVKLKYLNADIDYIEKAI